MVQCYIIPRLRPCITHGIYCYGPTTVQTGIIIVGVVIRTLTGYATTRGSNSGRGKKIMSSPNGS